MPVVPSTFRQLAPRLGFALVVGLALVLGSFVSDAAAYRGGGGGGARFRGGAGFAHGRGFGGSWSAGRRFGGFGGFGYAPRVHLFTPIHRYYRPRVSFSLGFGFGQPYYYDPPVVVERDHYIIEHDDSATPSEPAPTRDPYMQRGNPAPSEDDFDVTNQPPAGTYYYDPFCNQQFSTLDDYTEHLQHKDHAQTIEIVDKRTGDQLHTLEFVNGEWQPQLSE